jgi:acyl-CoA synthetase (AMP-forming)/AMP-acid ligase II
MVATMFHRVLRLPEEIKSKYDISSMRWILHGAAPCPVEVKKAMIDWMGPIVYEYYAATEGGGCFIQPLEWLDKPGSVGKANEGTEVKILDEEFNEVEIGQEGTIYFSAPSTGRFEYYKAEEKTSGAYWGDYFTMGDIGYCDSGLYSNRIIIPSYDSEGKLNFFVGRDFYNSKMKYKNCSSPKNIIGFDLFINWDEPIVLVEGPLKIIPKISSPFALSDSIVSKV